MCVHTLPCPLACPLSTQTHTPPTPPCPQAEYEREEIDWSYIQFVDNQDVLDLIEGKMGIFELLDEVCRWGGGWVGGAAAGWLAGWVGGGGGRPREGAGQLGSWPCPPVAPAVTCKFADPHRPPPCPTYEHTCACAHTASYKKPSP